MAECTRETAVTDWVIDQPGALAVLERLGIKYCCGGLSLEHACRKAGCDVNRVLAELQAPGRSD